MLFLILRLELLANIAKTLVGFALFFGPRTLGRTWGTRPDTSTIAESERNG
jgi:hypothetical protein